MKKLLIAATAMLVGGFVFAHGGKTVDAATALKKLKTGNSKFIKAKKGTGDISPARRSETAKNGQHPYATVVTCSDSRSVPESIFSCGIGDIFTIRVAGNVVDPQQLGSIEYAAEHLGTELVVILGHTNCGAVGAALEEVPTEGYIHYLTDDIKSAIGDEKDYAKAVELNTRAVAGEVQKEFGETVTVVGAIYNIETGEVSWLEQ